MTYPRDIWESSADWLVIPSNTQGIAGAGLAKQAAVRYPTQEQEYMRACRSGVHAVGYPVVTPLGGFKSEYKALYWMATKTVVQQPSRLSYIITGFEKLAHQMISNPQITVALPPVGCGLGGLQLHQVRQQYERLLRPYFADRIDLVGNWGDVEPEIYFDLRDGIASIIDENVNRGEEGAIDGFGTAEQIVDYIGLNYTVEKRNRG